MLIQRLPRLLSCPAYDVMMRYKLVPSLLPVTLRSCIFHLTRISSLAVTPQGTTNTCAVSPVTKRYFSVSSCVCAVKKSTGRKTTSAADDAVCQVFDQSDLLMGHMTVKQAEDLAKRDNLKLVDMGVNSDSMRCLKLMTGQEMAAESKRQRLERKNEKVKQVKDKEFRIASNIDEHDLATKLRQARDNIIRGGRAKFVIRAHRKSAEAEKDILRVSKKIRKDMDDCAQVKEGHKTASELMLLLVSLPTAHED